MRQAGRYMPEYQAVRKRYSLIEICKHPEIAAEVTIVAAEALGVDAAIIFADLLLPLEIMGLPFHFSAGEGPVIEKPIRGQADVSRLRTDRCADLPPSIGRVDVQALADASEGLSGADLRRVVDDGKLLFAYARSRGEQLQPPTAYFVAAIETVRKNKEQYAAAEARARVRHPVRPSYFDAFQMGSGSGGLAAFVGSEGFSEFSVVTGTQLDDG